MEAGTPTPTSATARNIRQRNDLLHESGFDRRIQTRSGKIRSKTLQQLALNNRRVQSHLVPSTLGYGRVPTTGTTAVGF